ncbi:MAG TPA: DUF2378 family protein [Polyangiaceae bacterium]|nr:DUF2378 family protein [Polyangiaceae bacterium]
MARIKGTSVIEIVRVLRKNKDAARALLPPELHRYLEDRLLSSSWYPEEDYLTLLLALGRVLSPLVSGDVWSFLGHQGAVKDFTGIYSSVIRHGDPWGALSHLNAIWHIYRDSGTLSLDRTGPGSARVLLRDYPTACPEVCGTVSGYLRAVVELSGGTDVKVVLLRAPRMDVGPSEWSLEFGVPRK